MNLPRACSPRDPHAACAEDAARRWRPTDGSVAPVSRRCARPAQAAPAARADADARAFSQWPRIARTEVASAAAPRTALRPSFALWLDTGVDLFISFNRIIEYCSGDCQGIGQSWLFRSPSPPQGARNHDPAPIPAHRSGGRIVSVRLRRTGRRRRRRPARRPPPYLKAAEATGMRIRYVIDTHLHADHVSAGRALAEAAGAEYVLFARRPPISRSSACATATCSNSAT